MANAHPSDASKSLRILILGGTGFIGPHHVRAAVARGHQVSVFNRGQKKAELPKSVECLVGDRNGDLESIRHRDWDAVLDLATYAPMGVRSLGEALNERIKHYTFISTLAVYEDPLAHPLVTENSPVLEYPDNIDAASLPPAADRYEYGALKVLCEREAQRQFAGRVLTLRLGHIVGPGDREGSFAYWPLRMKVGGEVLAVGDPVMPVQFIDVRDIAEWTIRMIEKRATGLYNVTGPASPITLGQLVEAARSVHPIRSKITWVPSAWLAAREDRYLWGKLLFWSYETEGWATIMRMSIEGAVSAGLTTRPLCDTLASALDWHHRYAEEPEGTVATGWQSKSDDGFVPITVPWTRYLDAEKAVLAAWRAHQGSRENMSDSQPHKR